MKQIFLLTFIISISIKSVAQSPWVPQVNEGFFQLGYSGLFYNQIRYNNEVKDFNRNTIDNTYQAYLDFGIAPKIGITAVLPFKSYSIEENNTVNSFSALSNVSVGAKYQVLDKNTKAAVGFKLDFNTSYADYDLGLRTGFNATTLMPYFTIGSGTAKTYFYSNLGYGLRSNDYSDFIRFSGEFGYKFIKNAYIVGVLDFTNPVNKNSEFFKKDLAIFQKSASFLDRQAFNGAGIKLLYDFKPNKFGLSLSTIGALSTNNTPFSRSYNFGLYRKF